MKRFVEVGLVLAAAAVAPIQAAVDLEWQLENENVQVGDTVRVGLYAVADNGVNEVIATMDVIVFWDPDILELLGNDNNGPYDWMAAGFFDDSAGDGLNDTFEDGNAYFKAWSHFPGLAEATAEGLLVTTIEFEALAADPGSDLEIIESFGIGSQTAVWSGAVPGLNIVDDLGSATIEILDGVPGDLDGDGDVDLQDLAILLAAYGVDAGGDVDGDGDTDLNDLALLLANYGHSV